jgi:anti-sigma B factor antagonist
MLTRCAISGWHGMPVTALDSRIVDILVERSGDATRLRLTGDLDLSSADELRGAGLRALREPDCRRLLVDMSEVPFMDSTGVGVLVELRNAGLPQGRALVIAEPSERVREVLRLTAMDQVFDVAPPSGPPKRVSV